MFCAELQWLGLTKIAPETVLRTVYHSTEPPRFIVKQVVFKVTDCDDRFIDMRLLLSWRMLVGRDLERASTPARLARLCQPDTCI